jgi:DNA-binding IclR family transcriptional regulator
MVYSAPALEKGLDIIELLSTEPDGLTANEIARRLKRSINEVFRMIMVMEQRRWLSQSSDNRYRVTYEVVKFAIRATPAQGLIDAAAPIMHDLARSTYQSSHLVVLSQQQGFVLHRQENVGPVGLACGWARQSIWWRAARAMCCWPSARPIWWMNCSRSCPGPRR